MRKSISESGALTSRLWREDHNSAADVPRQFDLSAGTDLRGALLAEADVAVEVADRDVGLCGHGPVSAVDANVSKCSFTYWTLSLNLEARALASRRLLLHGLDRHDLVLELASGL